MMKIILSVFIIAVLLSCSESTPKGIIPKEKMMGVLWSYMEANVYSFEQLRDTLQEDSLVNAKMQDSIFRKFDVTRLEFEHSYSFYSKNSAQFKVMLDTILARKQRIDTAGIIKRGVIPTQGL